MKTKLEKQSRVSLKLEYRTYLSKHRGLTEKTIYQYCTFVDRFLDFKFGDSPDDLSQITAHDITDFLLYVTGRVQPFRDKTIASNMRNLFRFLFQYEKIGTNLAIGIPSVAYKHARRIPYHLTQNQVEELLESVKTLPTSQCKKRNYAMVLLMARLGLRSPEVISIKLEDINWNNGEILIRGKGGYNDKTPLLQDIGEAIVDYIQNERKGNSEHLFLASHSPYNPFKDAQVFNGILTQSIERTNIRKPSAYSVSNILRHSLATNLVQQGASLEEISNTLRHRSRSTTLLYARQDINGLRTIAQKWPCQKGEKS
jgi:site-specific recombinase XerD